MRSFIEGHSSSSSEAWKILTKIFRNNFGISLSTHELEGGFFLSCLMTLIPAEYDLKCLNKNKVIFQDSEVIKEGFVRRLLPKIKSYYRYQDNFVDLCKYSRKDEKECKKII